MDAAAQHFKIFLLRCSKNYVAPPVAGI